MRERMTFVLTPSKQEMSRESESRTLLQSLGEVRFSPKQATAIRVLDVAQHPLWEKRLLFFYFLWQETGSFSPIKKFGEIREDTINSMIDKVMDNDNLLIDYDKFHEKYELEIRKEINPRENKLEKRVRQLKSEKIKHEDIAKRLKISKIRVNDVSKTLIAKKLIDPSPLGRANAKKFESFLKQVEELDNPKISDREIARRLNTSVSRIERARKRLRMQGRIWNRTPKDVAQSQKKSKDLLPLRERVRELNSIGLTRREIAELTGASIQQVKHQITILKRNSA